MPVIISRSVSGAVIIRAVALILLAGLMLNTLIVKVKCSTTTINTLYMSGK